MLQSFENVVSTFVEHPWFSSGLFLGLAIAVLVVFARNSAQDVVGGSVRLLVSIFEAPFRFIHSVLESLAAFRANESEEARSRTFLLHRSVQYARLAALVVAIAIVAAGLVVALLGLWPSAQLAQRSALRASLASVDSQYTVDSTRLAELTSSSAEVLARQRRERVASLEQDQAKARTSLDSWWDSTSTWAENDWDPGNWVDSLTARMRAAGAPYASVDHQRIAQRLLSVTQQARSGVLYDSETARYEFSQDSTLVALSPSLRPMMGELGAADASMDLLFRGFLLALDAVQARHELRRLASAPSTDELRSLTEAQLGQLDGQRDSIKQELAAIDWFGGVKFFFQTLLLTFLYFVGFVWAAGVAIESALLFIGIARDLVAIRTRMDEAHKES